MFGQDAISSVCSFTLKPVCTVFDPAQNLFSVFMFMCFEIYPVLQFILILCFYHFHDAYCILITLLMALIFIHTLTLWEIQDLHAAAAAHFIRRLCHILICVKCCQMLQSPLLMQMPADNQQMVPRYHVPSCKSSQPPDDTDTEKGDVSVNISESTGV